MTEGSFESLDKESAILIQEKALSAIQSLSEIINLGLQLTPKDFKVLKKAIGMTIVAVDENILLKLEEKYPEINNLR